MAEVTGNIGSEYVELDNAATEATLQELLQATLLMAKKTGQSGVGINSRINELLAGMDKNAAKTMRNTKLDGAQRAQESKDRQAAAKKEAKLTDESEKKKEKLNEASKKSATQLTSTIRNLANGVLNTISDLSNMGDSLTAAANMYKVIPAIGGPMAKMFGMVTGAAEKLQGTFNASAAIGANFGGSMIEFERNATLAGVTIDQFGEILGKNGEFLAMYGEGTANGAKQFAKISKSLKTTLGTEGLAELGYTTQQANEVMVQYISRLRRSNTLTDAELRDSAKMANITAGYMKNLDAVSKLTGKSKEALMAEEETNLMDAKFALAQAAETNVVTQQSMQDIVKLMPDAFKAGAREGLSTGTFTSQSSIDMQLFAKETRALIQQAYAMRKSGQEVGPELVTKIRESIIASAQQHANDYATGAGIAGSAQFNDNWNDILSQLMKIKEQGSSYTGIVDQTKTEQASNTDTMATDILLAKQKVAEISNTVTAELAKQVGLFTETFEWSVNKIKDFIKNLDLDSDDFKSLLISSTVALGALNVAGAVGAVVTALTGLLGVAGIGGAGLLGVTSALAVLGGGALAAFAIFDAFNAAKNGESLFNTGARQIGLVKSEEDIANGTDSRSNWNPLKYLGALIDFPMEAIADASVAAENDLSRLGKWWDAQKQKNSEWAKAIRTDNKSEESKPKKETSKPEAKPKETPKPEAKPKEEPKLGIDKLLDVEKSLAASKITEINDSLTTSLSGIKPTIVETGVIIDNMKVLATKLSTIMSSLGESLFTSKTVISNALANISTVLNEYSDKLKISNDTSLLNDSIASLINNLNQSSDITAKGIQLTVDNQTDMLKKIPEVTSLLDNIILLSKDVVTSAYDNVKQMLSMQQQIANNLNSMPIITDAKTSQDFTNNMKDALITAKDNVNTPNDSLFKLISSGIAKNKETFYEIAAYNKKFNKSNIESIMNTAELKQTSLTTNTLAAAKQLLAVGDKENEIKSKQKIKEEKQIPELNREELANYNKIQDVPKNDIAGLNTRLDALIGQVAGLTEINRRQLSVQKGLSGDAFA